MAGAKVGYKRVSSTDQCLARQLDGLELDKIFEDKCSGKDSNRPQLQACIEYLRENDVLFIHSIDRLARNLYDLQNIVCELTNSGVTVHFVKENLSFQPDSTSSPMQKLMFQMLGAFAEFERSLTRERQREGIIKAQKEGRPLGRTKSLTKEQVQELRERAAKGERKAALASAFGISRQSVYHYISNK